MAKSRPTAPANAADQHNIIGASTTVEGTLRSAGNVNISGTVDGNVEVEGRTMVMAGGSIEGELASTSAEVAGVVKGRVTVKERLVLKASAVVEGDIRTGKLIVEDGATFNGQCHMGADVPSRPASTDRPARSGGSAVVGTVADTA
ncbi:bactofilin family protein [Rubrivirga sp. IMCC45206]|uniref:bactofilin family protein n=1 Tax=Rubrivirga sp. IMCC45206 TaxID=3391614 RepID=UPI00398FD1F4